MSQLKIKIYLKISKQSRSGNYGRTCKSSGLWEAVLRVGQGRKRKLLLCIVYPPLFIFNHMHVSYNLTTNASLIL